MAHYEDVAIEMARLVRELEAVVDRRLRSRQLGEAWVGLVDDRRKIEGEQDRAA